MVCEGSLSLRILYLLPYQKYSINISTIRFAQSCSSTWSAFDFIPRLQSSPLLFLSAKQRWEHSGRTFFNRLVVAVNIWRINGAKCFDFFVFPQCMLDSYVGTCHFFARPRLKSVTIHDKDHPPICHWTIMRETKTMMDIRFFYWLLRLSLPLRCKF